MEPLTLVLTALGGQAVLVAAVAWLSKGLLAQVLAKELEQFKATLSRESALAIEQAKHALQLRATERQVVFSTLHAKRADVIASLHSHIFKLNDAVDLFSSASVGEVPSEKKKHYLESLQALIAAAGYFREHRLYLPEAIVDLMSGYLEKVHREVMELGVFARLDDSTATPDVMARKYEAWGKTNEFLRQQLPQALAQLESEFRQIIGAQ